MSKLTMAAAMALAMTATLPAFGADEGYLKVHANPGRTGVFLDGKYLGPAANFKVARKYAVAPGTHELKLDDPRCEAVTKSIEVKAGKTTVVAETMKDLPKAVGPFGMIRVQGTDKFAAVFVNNKFMGHKDEFDNASQRLLLPPGEYTVRVVPTNGAPHEEKINLQANQETLINVK